MLVSNCYTFTKPHISEKNILGSLFLWFWNNGHIGYSRAEFLTRGIESHLKHFKKILMSGSYTYRFEKHSESTPIYNHSNKIFFHKQRGSSVVPEKGRMNKLFSAHLSGLGLFPFPCTSMSSSEESAGEAILVLSKRCSCWARYWDGVCLAARAQCSSSRCSRGRLALKKRGRDGKVVFPVLGPSQ